MKKIFSLLAGISACLFAAACSAPQQALPENTIFLDVRTEKEFNAGHLPGSLLIPHDQLQEKAPALLSDKSIPIAVYCRSGRRSAMAKKRLESLGYTAVIDLGALENAAEISGKSIQSGK